MLRGIDISRWQTTTPSLAGLSFAFARATYGTWIDQKYHTHTTNFRKAKLVTGAYHFGVGWTTPEAQARTFLSVAEKADLLILDLERDTALTMTHTQARRFIALIHAAGRKVGLYHSRSGFPNLGQDYNWIAQWGSTAPTGISWAFWQYRGSPLDLNYFRGDLTALLRLADIPIPTPPTVDPIFYRARARAYAGSWWDYKVTGNRTIGYTITGRTTRRTRGGWSANIQALRSPIIWSHHERKLAQVLAPSAYAGSWIDLNDTLITQLPL